MKDKNSYYREEENYAFADDYVWWKKVMWVVIMFSFYILVIPICLIGYSISRLIDKIFKREKINEN